MSTGGYTGGSEDIRIVLQQSNIHNSNTIGITQDLNAIQMVTASNIDSRGQHYGFLLSGSNTTSSDDLGSNFLLPFSQNDPNSGFTGVEDTSRLSIGGPQLALLHSYNQLIASQSIRPALGTCFPQSQSDVWIPEGLSPSLPENYYEWSPSASDCPFFEDNSLPFLIERGDILRVEGIKSVHSPTISKLTSSIDFNEDFAVTEVQNFSYTGSDFQVPPGTLVVGSSPLNSNVVGGNYPLSGLTGGSPPATTSIVTTLDAVLSSGTGGFIELTLTTSFRDGVYTSQIKTSNMVIFAYGAPGTGYAVGDVVEVTQATINSFLGAGASTAGNLVITLDSSMVVGGVGNNFTTAVALNPDCDTTEIITATSLLTSTSGVGSNYNTMTSTIVTPSGGTNSGTGATFNLTFGSTNGSATLTAISCATGGENYVAGNTFTWDAATLNAAIDAVSGGTSTGTGTLTLTLDSLTDFPPAEAPYQQYDIGKVGLTLPTFLKTDRNPSEVLEGLEAGSITKFTIRRQVENEQSVMIQNTQAPKTSQGFLTQTGGGFLIPNDLSSTQKSNALNIINQLRQKNAFPGDSATDSN